MLLQGPLADLGDLGVIDLDFVGGPCRLWQANRVLRRREEIANARPVSPTLGKTIATLTFIKGEINTLPAEQGRLHPGQASLP
jgi:hypothetical protein